MAKALQKFVLITGCDVPNSYGYELALCLDKQGFGVFAGCFDCNSLGARSLASRGSTRLAILQIDVTKQEEIDDAVDMIQDIVDDEGMWALINCAESYAVAEVEWFSNEDFEKIMQINFLGTVRLTKAVVPLLRKTKGRIVNLSNLAGCISRCGLSAFSASKFAVEAFSDSLRQEMLKWGVFVSVVQPAFLPGSKDLLSDAETSVRLKRVPKDLKDLYGEDYFVDYIRSVSGSSKSDKEKFSAKSSPSSSSSTLSSGYSSLSSIESKSLKRRKKENRRNSKSPNAEKKDFLDDKHSQTLSSTMTPTLKAQGSSNLSSMNRVLHALVDAVTSPSPKVRYFVGSIQDHLVKSVSPVLPTIFIDSYYMSGEITKVIPKKLKEKRD